MTRFYNLEDIDGDLNRKLEEAQELLKAWKAVTFPTKKDGKPYANMKKNFDGASYASSQYAMYECEKVLKVHIYSEIGTLYSDFFNCYEVTRYMKDAGKLEKTQNIFDGYYVYDLDDIKEEVEKRIAYWQGRIESLEKQIENEGTAYSKFKTAFETALLELKDVSGGNTDLFYAVKDSVCGDCLLW